MSRKRLRISDLGYKYLLNKTPLFRLNIIFSAVTIEDSGNRKILKKKNTKNWILKLCKKKMYNS